MGRIVSSFFATILLVGVLFSAFRIVPAAIGMIGIIYIRADGSIDPPTAPIQRNEDIYTLTANIASNSTGMQVEKNNIVIDGNGYTLQGVGDYFDGIRLVQNENVTVQNMKIKAFSSGILLDSSFNITISGNKIMNNLDGVRLGYSSCYNTISGNNITANGNCGIVLYSHCNCSSFSGNEITNNMYGIALSLFSANNSFSGNNITGNSYEGIYLQSSCTYNSFGENRITGSYEGIALESFSNYNSFSGNNITNNEYGIRIGSAFQNSFCFNRFVDNGQQVIFDIVGYVNVWDNGYPSGGNHWSDYAGVDVYCGAYQNETGSDGIGDVPYVIDVRNQDHYPFIIHNVAVIDILPSRSIIGVGDSMNIRVTAANRGGYTETFRLAVYINETEIETQEVTLSMSDSTTFIFTWNATGFAEGHYAIGAIIDPLPDEMSLKDNSLIGQTVRVAAGAPVLGDLNADGIVNILDLTRIAIKFGMTYPNVGWDIDADINDDGKINILDLVVVAIHFGETG